MTGHPNNLAELRNSEANSAPRNLIYGATLSTRSREFQSGGKNIADWMDKNKNRTDLLAVGRQKLQQFRKKDGKGNSSRGKSSKKSKKSDADAASSVAKPEVLSLASEGETAAVDLDVSQPIVSVAGNVETVVAHNDGVPSEVVDLGECDVDSMTSTEIPSSTDISVSEVGRKHDIVPHPSTSVDAIEGTVVELNLADANKEMGHNPLLSQDDFPDTSLSQAKGRSGAVQEADGLGLNRFDRSGETKFDVDCKLPLSEHVDCAIPLEGATSEVTSVEEQSSEAEQSISIDDASLSTGAASSSQADERLAASYQLTNKHAEEVISCSHVEEQEICSPSGDYGDDKTLEEKQQHLPKGSFVSQDGSHERSHLTKWASLSDPTLSLLRDGSPVRLSQLVEVIRSLDEDGYRHLLNLQVLVSTADVGPDSLAPSSHPDLFAKVKEELYLTTSTKDILYLQLAEQSDLHTESDQCRLQLIDEISVLRSSINEVLERNACLVDELAECRSELQVFASEREENLNGNLALVTEERKKLAEDKEHFVHENKKLASELLVLQEQLATEHGQQIQLEAELKDVTLRLEKLIEENSLLNASLDVHKAKLAEIDGRETDNIETGSQVKNLDVGSGVNENATENERSCQIPWKRDPELSTVVLGKGLPNDVGGLLLEQEIFDDYSGFLVLKEHLKDAERIFQNLGKAIEQMHSHSVSSQRSSSKPGVPGVSKLIHSFESKMPHDESEIEERGATECQSLGDLFNSTKEITEDLSAVLKLLVQDADNASSMYRGERDRRKSANLTFGELMVLHEALKEYSDNLEVSNIELEVLYEAAKQHAFLVEAKNNELEVLYAALKQQESGCSSENAELCQQLSEYQIRLTEMQGHFSDLQKRSDEMASDLNQQLERSQKEAAERALSLELEWKSKVTQIVETVRRLDEYVGRVFNPSFSNNSNGILDTSSQVATSVSSAIKVIQDLQEELQAAYAGHDATSSSYTEVNEKYNDLLRTNEFLTQMLHEIYNGLKKLVIDSCALGKAEINPQVEKLPDLLDYSKYTIFIEQLENVLGERLHLQSVNDQLNSELMNRTRDFEEMSRECRFDSNAIQELIEHVENVIELEDYETDSDKAPASRLEVLVYLLVKKYKELVKQVSDCRKESGSKVIKLTELEEKIDQLDALRLQQELETLTLKESLLQEKEALVIAHSDLQEKISELEQSEQRVSSVREKLSIAVAKGKGLVVQRDCLKQSLAETSAELERCSQELRAKDARIQELEIKLKTYSEAGERVDALESELSYIRNSATALRESFLLKDSVLQRIEEILEDLDLPEHFHSRDIIEKVDWLARSTTGNSLPPTDWDQQSSIGGLHSDAGVVSVDTWKEDAQGSTLGEDLRRKYEDLQSKFYGMAEQNEMLEQSLMERNHLVQKWEEVLDGIYMPSQLRSMEPEGKIEWLGVALSEANHEKNSLQKKIDDLENYCGSLAADLEASEKRVSSLEADLQSVMLERDALSDANHERNSLQKKIDNLENYCGSLAADLEESEKRVSNLEADLQSVMLERDQLSERLETTTSNHHNLLAKAAHFEVENDKLQIRCTSLQEELVKRSKEEEHLLEMDAEIRRLQHLVSDVLQDADAEDLVLGGSSTACLEGLLKKLIENYTNPKSVNPELVETKPGDAILDARSRDTLNSEEDVASLKKELEAMLHELMQVKEERDEIFGKHQSLLHEVQALERKREELQELLSQEEQKSASLREKLNVAVRKGKSLVQQRDSMKKAIEEMNAELECLKSELSRRENALADYESKMRDFSVYPERIEALEADRLSLRNHLSETEHMLEEKGHILSRISNTIADIDVGGEIIIFDPVEKLGQIEKICHDLRSAAASSEQESRKSKRAAELLLAELNEVQERNDALQEDVAKLSSELTEVIKEKDVAEAAKVDILSRLENLSTNHSEVKRKQYSELMMFQSSISALRKGVNDVHNLLSNVFSKDLEFLQNLEVNIKLCLEGGDAKDVSGSPYSTPSNLEDKENIQFVDTWPVVNMQDPLDDNAIVEVCGLIWHYLQILRTEITALKEKLIVQSKSLQEKGHGIWNVLGILYRERNSMTESFEAMKRNIMHIESVGKEKDKEIVVLRRNITLLYETCANSVLEIENQKAELLGNNFVAADLVSNMKPVISADGVLSFSGQNSVATEENIKTMADKLFSTVKDFLNMKAEIIEGSEREMKITIANLQKELQEKDIQKDRMRMELVDQIKLAEVSAANHLRDLQSSKTLVHDLEKELETMREEQTSLQQRVKELQDVQANTVELQDRVKSFTDLLSSKDQGMFHFLNPTFSFPYKLIWFWNLHF
ncbi:hypothetical protein V6N11_061588 [Hibiscus sabdariffa]|uniref:Uncharacterized protein n=1 Tax=Hibiscus sabdariffa TaxID=183260 RepID=A0ABR2NW27_9ROSI